MSADEKESIFEDIKMELLIAEGNYWYDKARALYDSEEAFEQAQIDLAPLIYAKMKKQKEVPRSIYRLRR